MQNKEGRQKNWSSWENKVCHIIPFVVKAALGKCAAQYATGLN